MNTALDYFKSNLSHRRHWWFKDHDYLPAVYRALRQNDMETLLAWFKDTAEKSLIGECGIPSISVLLALIEGNGIERIVQCGHYSGYSTLMLGFALREMNIKNGLITFDISEEMTGYTNSWIKKAGLDRYVSVRVGNTTHADTTRQTEEFFEGKSPQLVFIDSSHEYQQTLYELSIWMNALQVGGFCVLHDASRFAASFDKTGRGGVNAALYEWGAEDGKWLQTTSQMIIAEYPEAKVYKDGCGLGIIVK